MSVDPATIAMLPAKDRFEWFIQEARYRPDAPEGQGVKYHLRWGSGWLRADDTHELRLMMERKCRQLRGKNQ